MQLVTEQETTSPVAVFGPLPEGNRGAMVACSQVVPSRYQPVAVSHPVQVVYELLQSLQWAVEQATTVPNPVLAP